jgi:hypothetical protein
MYSKNGQVATTMSSQQSPPPSDGLGRLLEGMLDVSRLMRHGQQIMKVVLRLFLVFGLSTAWRPSEQKVFDIWIGESEIRGGWYDVVRAGPPFEGLLFLKIRSPVIEAGSIAPSTKRCLSLCLRQQ